MMGLAREFRLIPVVLFAAVCLLTLKVIGIVRDGGYTLAEPPETFKTTGVKQSWAREMFNYPNAAAPVGEKKPAERIATASKKDNFGDITGSVSESKPVEKPAAKKRSGPADAIDPPRDPGGTLVSLEPHRPAAGAERAILERLQERRQEIEAHARELEIRDGLLKAAEKRLETRLAELKEIEARVSTAVQNKDDADASRFKGLISMYENMKAKDAAKIFDRLELNVLVQVTSQINPRRMSDILGQMSPETAERLTVELASRAATEKAPAVVQLPKIQGKPGN